MLSVAAARVYNELGFTDETDPATGFGMLIPTKLLTSHRPSRFGTHWQNSDDSIELETLAIPESQTSFAELLSRLQSADDRTIDYSFVTDSLFVLSGDVGGLKFYTAFVRSGSLSQGFSVSWAPTRDAVGRIVSVFLASAIQFPGAATPAPQTEESSVSAGSGFAISTNGTIVTNAHVIDGCGSIEVTGLGVASAIAVDKDRDLAVIRLSSGHTASAATIQPDAPRLGQAIVILGYPLSYYMGNALTVSTGVVSSLSGLGGDPRAFTVSANIQPGNSGGPVLNMHGEVIGVAQLMFNEAELLKEEGTTGGNVGFAINAATLVDFLRPFKSNPAKASAGTELTVEDIANLAKQFTVQVVCNTVPQTETSVSSSSERYQVNGIADNDVLNMRAGPGTDHPIVTAIPPDGSGISVGECQVVEGYRYDWCHVSWHGLSGWVSGGFLLNEQTGQPPG